MANNQNSTYQTYELEPQPDIKAFLYRYWRYRVWFIISLLLAIAITYIYLLYQAPIYKINASLLVKDESKGASKENSLKELDLFTTNKVIEDEIVVLKSYSIMSRVVEKLGVDIQYYYSNNGFDREIYEESPIRLIIENPTPQLYNKKLEFEFLDDKTIKLDNVKYPINHSVKTPYGHIRIFAKKLLTNGTPAVIAKISKPSLVINKYRRNINIEPAAKESSILELSLEESVPDKGEAILNQLIYEYSREAVFNKNKEANITLRFIEERLELISGELLTIEKEVELYKSSQGILDLSSQAETFLKNVKENDERLNELDIRLKGLENIEQYVKNSGDKSVTPATLGLNDPILTSLLNKASELELKRDESSRLMSINSPSLLSLNSQIKTIKSNINENILTIRQQLTSHRNQLLINNRQLEKMIRTIPGKERALLNITRQQVIKNGLYTYLLQKREEIALSAAATMSDTRIVDKAMTSDFPVGPIKSTTYLLGIVFGLIIPIGVITFKNTFSSRVVKRSDVEGVTQVPIISEIIESQRLLNEKFIFNTQAQSVIGEQIRSLRTNLQFLRSNPYDNQVLLFTSSISGEGKSFVSLNLGASLAVTDQFIVIIEMDMRQPKLHETLNLENVIGLSNYLKGESTLDEILQPIDGYENYCIITAGPLPSNPSELLSGPLLKQLFAELKKRFNYILVDSPPIGLVTDSQLIASHADATIYLVRHNYTPKKYLKMINLLYTEERFPKLSIILNGIEEGKSNYAYHNYAGLATKHWTNF